ncbi:hypothetical protein KR018_002821 [Drosophila ironensis]|nr:hypothetical protein KR018_002821 [Drosophila ironensis]
MQHASQQIAQFEQQKLQLEQQLMVAQKAQPPHMHPGGPPPKNIPSLMAQRIAMPGVNHEQMGQPPATHDPQGNNLYPGGNYHQQPHPAQQPSNPFADPRGPNFFIPDMSKPPPGFAGPMHPHNPMPLQQQPQPQQQQLNQQNPSPFPPMQQGQGGGGGGGSEPPVDLGVLNAAIQAVMQMQRHPDDPQSQQMQQQPPHPQQQQQQLAGYPPNIRPGPSPGNNLEEDVDLDVLNEAIRAVISNKTDDPGQAQQPPHQMEDGQQPGEGEETADGEPVAIGEPQIPTAPYYDLPAGLMVPLIRLEDYNYKALDPADIRLPAPAPQSERLTNALNAFYAAPSHDHPRDNEGWEKLGLYEYYKVKNAARKQKEEEISNGTREKSRSPSPILLEKPEPKKPKKRSYRSKSRSRSRSKTPPHRDRSRSHSRSRSRSPERSSTPPPLPRNRMGGGGNNRKGNNRSPRHERDTNSSNNNQENRSERTNSSNNGNNASRRVERDRSPTPPSFMGAGGPKPAEYLDESNKGHQMLKKMGWAGTGTGLGSKNQGIDKPISGGEVRDRRDMYRGVGINMNDPFESFRKNKGAAFAHRMRTRDDKS